MIDDSHILIKKKNPKITTRVTKAVKPHDKFKAILQFESVPTRLIIKGEDTEHELVSMAKNPEKYSFGQIPFKNGYMEFYQYPRKNLNSVLASSNYGDFVKETFFACDLRRIKEIHALIMKIHYYLHLDKEKKHGYLRKNGFNC